MSLKKTALENVHIYGYETSTVALIRKFYMLQITAPLYTTQLGPWMWDCSMRMLTLDIRMLTRPDSC